MNEKEIKALWQSSIEKLEMSQTINKQNTLDITQLKVQNFLSSMKPIKIFIISIGILWVFMGTVVLTHLFIYAFTDVSKFFLYSATFQVGLTAIALLLYLYQLITIFLVDISEPILKTQEKLASLINSTLWITRVLFLQLPFWTTFYWNDTMFENGNLLLWIIQGIVTLSFTYAAIWLFFNIRYENKNKKWFQLIFKGKEWTPLIRSIELLNQIEEFKAENKN